MEVLRYLCLLISMICSICIALMSMTISFCNLRTKSALQWFFLTLIFNWPCYIVLIWDQIVFCAICFPMISPLNILPCKYLAILKLHEHTEFRKSDHSFWILFSIFHWDHRSFIKSNPAVYLGLSVFTEDFFQSGK